MYTIDSNPGVERTFTIIIIMVMQDEASVTYSHVQNTFLFAGALLQ